MDQDAPVQRRAADDGRQRPGAGCKLALSIATNMTVLIMLYGCMMGNYDSLYLPMMILGHVFAVPFFLLTVRTAQKKGQKASLVRSVGVTLICYVGVLALLLWKQGDPAFTFSIYEGALFGPDFRVFHGPAFFWLKNDNRRNLCVIHRFRRLSLFLPGRDRVFPYLSKKARPLLFSRLGSATQEHIAKTGTFRAFCL